MSTNKRRFFRSLSPPPAEPQLDVLTLRLIEFDPPAAAAAATAAAFSFAFFFALYVARFSQRNGILAETRHGRSQVSSRADSRQARPKAEHIAQTESKELARYVIGKSLQGDTYLALAFFSRSRSAGLCFVASFCPLDVSIALSASAASASATSLAPSNVPAGAVALRPSDAPADTGTASTI